MGICAQSHRGLSLDATCYIVYFTSNVMSETERNLEEIQIENDKIIMKIFDLEYEKYCSQKSQVEV